MALKVENQTIIHNFKYTTNNVTNQFYDNSNNFNIRVLLHILKKILNHFNKTHSGPSIIPVWCYL